MRMPLSFRLPLTCLLVSLLLVPLQGQAKKSSDVELQRSMDTAFAYSGEAFELDLENKYGNINIEVWDQQDVSVNVSISVRGKDNEKAQKILDDIDLSFAQSGNYLRLHTITKGGGKQVGQLLRDISPFDKTKVDIDYRLRVPASSSLTLINKFGNVTLGDISGDLDLTLSYGDLRAVRLPREAKLDCSFGNADITSIESAEICLKNARLDLRRAIALKVISSSSHLDIEKVQKLQISSKRDDYRIDEVEFIEGDASFTDMRIRLLKAGGDLELSFGICEIEKVSPSLVELGIDQRNCEVELNVEGLDFDLQAYLDEGKLVLPQNMPGLDVKYIDQKKQIRTITAGQGAKARIILKGKGGEIVFFR